MGYEKDDDASLVRTFLAQNPSLVSESTRIQRPDSSRPSELICRLLETVHTLAAVEALALGNKLGISTSTLAPIISNAAGASESFKKVAPCIVAGDLLSGYTITQTRDMLVSASSSKLTSTRLTKSTERSHHPCSSAQLSPATRSYYIPTLATGCDLRPGWGRPSSTSQVMDNVRYFCQTLVYHLI